MNPLSSQALSAIGRSFDRTLQFERIAKPISTVRQHHSEVRKFRFGRRLRFEALETRQLLTGDTTSISDDLTYFDAPNAELLESPEIAGLDDFAKEVAAARIPRAPISSSVGDLELVEIDLSERQTTPNGLYEVHMNSKQNRIVVRDAETGGRLWRKRVENGNFDIYAFYARDEGIYIHQQDITGDEPVPLLRRMGYPEADYVQTINPPGGIRIFAPENLDPIRFVVGASEAVIIGTDHTQRWIDLITGQEIPGDDEPPAPELAVNEPTVSGYEVTVTGTVLHFENADHQLTVDFGSGPIDISDTVTVNTFSHTETLTAGTYHVRIEMVEQNSGAVIVFSDHGNIVVEEEEPPLPAGQVSPDGRHLVAEVGSDLVIYDTQSNEEIGRRTVIESTISLISHQIYDNAIYVFQDQTTENFTFHDPTSADHEMVMSELSFDGDNFIEIFPEGGIHLITPEYLEVLQFVVGAETPRALIIGTDEAEREIDLITGQQIVTDAVVEPEVTYDSVGRIATIQMLDEAQTIVTVTYLNGTADSKVSGITKIYEGEVPAGEPFETVFQMTDMSVTENDTNGSTTNEYRFERLDVRQLGARGDGEFNETLLLETALRTGLNVYLPTGTYRTTSTLKITNKGQILSGAGADQAVLAYEGNNHALTIEATSFVQVKTLQIRTEASGIVIDPGLNGAISTNHNIDDVTLIGPGADVAGSRLVVFLPPSQWGHSNYFHTIQNSRLSHAEVPIDFTGDPNGANVQRVINSEISNYKTGIRVGSDENQILGVRFLDDAGTPAEPAVGIRVLSGSSFTNIHGVLGTDNSTHTLVIVDSGARRNAIVNIPAGADPVDNGIETLIMHKVTNEAVADLMPQEILDGTATSYHLSDFNLPVSGADITETLKLTLQQGVRMFIPPGTYRITEQIKIIDGQDIILEGSGTRATTLIYDNPNAAPGVEEFGIVFENCDNCVIRNLRIQTQNSGILVSGNSTHVGFDNLDVTNIGDPVGHTAVKFDVADTGGTNYLTNSQVGKAERGVHIAGGSVNLFNNTFFRYYAGVYVESDDNRITGGVFHQAPPFGPNKEITVGVLFAGNASNSRVVGMAAEPGTQSTNVYYEEDTSNNTVVVLRNTGILPTDLGTNNSTYSKNGAKTAEILAGDDSGTAYTRTSFVRELTFIRGKATFQSPTGDNVFRATVTGLPISLATDDILTLATSAGLGDFDLQITTNPSANSIEIVWTWTGSGTAPDVDGSYYFTAWRPK